MRIVAALGGNAILQPGQAPTADVQRANIARAARALGGVAAEHDLVVTHGNGPQVGRLARESAAEGAPRTLDVLDAETEGMLGYWIEQALRNALPGREVATLLTQVEVAGDDPAFAHPTKPIGADGRLVASPRPLRILALPAIRRLADAGVLVVCAGGGGIPVVRDADGGLSGVEAVVDKDRTAALLAAELGAAMLLLLTDVDAVHRSWPGRDAPIRAIAPAALRALPLDAGTMGPKAEAACDFVERTGGVAAIGALDDAAELVAGRAGTRVASG
ncbi:MAG: carbamate kinase [Myxococcota bacterium]